MTRINPQVHVNDFLTYYSNEKLNSILKKKGVSIEQWHASLNIKMINIAIEGLLGYRLSDKLSKAYRILQNSNYVRPETEARRGKFLLIRAIAKCGTMWPWAGDAEDSQYRHVVWWVGSTARKKILAYGNLSNYRGSANIAALDKASWRPSRDDTYTYLRDAMCQNALSPEWKDFPDIEKGSVRGLLSTCFNEGVERSLLLHEAEVVEMLLRVDYIEHDEDQRDVICGSPLWVRQVTKQVPGTYYTGETTTVFSYNSLRSEKHDISAIADWNGHSWANVQWGPSYWPGSSSPDHAPTLPSKNNPPKLDNIIKLIEI